MGYSDAYPGGYSGSGDAILSVYLETEPDDWYELTDQVISGTIVRGRQDQLDRYQAGTCDLLLSNDDRMFDPTYAASPLNGYVRPMRRLKVNGTYAGFTYALFQGYVDRWTQNRDGPHRGTTSVAATDGFKVLERINLAMSVSAQVSGDRVEAILDAAGWPAADRAVDPGRTDLQAADIDMTALEHLQIVAETEYGNLYVNAMGELRFEDRNSAVNQVPSEAFSDSAGTDLPFTFSNPEISDEQIRNDVTINRDGGTPQNASDATSIATYLTASYFRDGLYHTTDEHSLRMAEFILQAFKDPVERVSAMTVNPYRDPENLWPAVLGLELTDRVTLEETPQWVTPAVTRTLVVEGIAHEFGPKSWGTSFNLSENAVAIQGYWELGEAGFSELGETTRLFF